MAFKCIKCHFDFIIAFLIIMFFFTKKVELDVQLKVQILVIRFTNILIHYKLLNIIFIYVYFF